MKEIEKIARIMGSDTDECIPNPKFLLFSKISIVSNAVVVTLGMCVALPLGYVTKYFEHVCVLSANPAFIKPPEVNTTYITLDSSVDVTSWGNQHHCYYAIYLPVVVAIHAFIWSWFLFSMTRMIAQGHELPAYLMNAILNLIIFFALIVSSSILSSGFSTFCKNVEANLRQVNLQMSCRGSQSLSWSIFTQKGKAKSRNFYSFLLMSQVCSWLLTGMALFQCVLAVYMGIKTVYHYSSALSPPKKGKEKTYAYTNHLLSSYSNFLMDDETGSLIGLHTAKKDHNDSEEFFKL